MAHISYLLIIKNNYRIYHGAKLSHIEDDRKLAGVHKDVLTKK
jgi:hypothetical protein